MELGSLNDMKNKVCVITGASSGIGEAVLVNLNKAGARVFNLDVVTPKNSLKKHYISCDVRSLEQITSAIDSIVKKEGRLDALFANAGVYLAKPIELCTESEMERIIDINFKGILFTVKVALPHFLKQNSGAIVLAGSDQALVGKGKSPVYGATKGAIAALTKSLAVQYASVGIRVNCICPGPIETALFEDAIQQSLKIDPQATEITLKEASAKKCPVGRIGQAAEVATAVHYLLSEEASFITGALLTIDGGYTAQ